MELALWLDYPLREFEHEVLKAVILEANGVPVRRLILLGRPGAVQIAEGPWFKRVRRWASQQGLSISVRELRPG